MDEPLTPPPPRPAGRRWWLLAPIGCLVVALAPIGAGLLVVPRFAWQIVSAVSDAHAMRGRLLAEALAGGDAGVAYEAADRRFQDAYAPADLRAFLETHAAVLSPPGRSVHLSERTVNDDSCVASAYDVDGAEYVVYATRDGETLRLLGLRPGLEDAVPAGLRHRAEDE